MIKYKPYLLGLIILLISATILFLMRNAYLFGDELIHFRTIKDFTNLNITQETFLRDAKFPGYEVLIAVFRKILGINSIYGTRIINFFISSLCIYIFYLISKILDVKNARIKTLQFFFFPLIFVFFFLLYTDILSILLLIFSFYLILKGRYVSSGIPAVLSILVRQNNVLWTIFFLLLIAGKHKGYFIEHLKNSWIYLVGILSFTSFVIINRGVTIGAMNKTYQPIALHSENFYFFLFLSFFLFLPSIIINYKEVITMFRKKSLLALSLVFFAIYITTFKNTHPWNNILLNYFVRNEILHIITLNLLTKIIFFIPIIISSFYLLSLRLHGDYKLKLLIFTFFFLIFSWLVDPRYYIIPFTLLLLLKKEGSKKIEFITIIIYIIFSFTILFATLNKIFFI